MPRLSTVLGFVLIALVLVVAGCKQGIGGRCEINRDCASGRCSRNGAGMNGVCLETTSPVDTGVTPPDASADMSMTDAEQEAVATDAQEAGASDAQEAGAPEAGAAEAGAEVGGDAAGDATVD
jgi:hypothetical protein